MKRIRISLRQPAPEALRQATRIVREGGVVVHPAEALYGLGCDPAQAVALKKILALKKRPADKGMLVLIPDISYVADMAHRVPSSFEMFCQHLWPGPFTFLLPASSRLSPLLTGTEGKIGLRISDSGFLKTWLQDLGAPLVSTSANLSGSPPIQDPDKLEAIFDSADLLLDAGPLSSGPASTVIDLTESRPQILRRGEGWAAAQKIIDGFLGSER